MSRKIRARTFVLQRILAAAVLTLFVPMFARAGSIITIVNTDGTPGTSAPGVMGPFSLINSEVTSIGQFTQPAGSLLNFTTGAYITGSGSLMTGGAQWSGTGSTFTITETWNNFSGTIFTGSFSGNITWVFNGCVNNVCDYELTGPISGTWANGVTVNGQTTQIFFKFHGHYNGGSGLVDTGGTTSIVTPEPGTLGLMGMGLMGMGLVVRHKIKSGSPNQS
jgi:hypothetical protein